MRWWIRYEGGLLYTVGSTFYRRWISIFGVCFGMDIGGGILDKSGGFLFYPC